jgi:hypothetical protein
VVTPDLEAEVRAAYGNDGGTAVDVLNTYRPGEQGEGVERVRRAVLTLADGDLERLRHLTQQAQQDFRDVLFWADNPPSPDEPTTYAELRERLGLPPDADHPGE